MSIYKLMGTATGGNELSAGTLDIQFDGKISAIHYSVRADFDADGDVAVCEVSFLSSLTTAVNDTRGSIIMVQNQHAVGAAGAVNSNMNGSVSGVNIPVTAGERIHLHFGNTAALTGAANFYLYVDDAVNTELRRRR